MRKGVLVTLATSLGVVAVAFCNVPAATAAPGPVTGVERVGNPPRLLPGLVKLGSVATSVQLHAEVALTPRNPAGLEQFVSAVSTPGSPQYRQFLTKGEFAARFGATAGTLSSLRAGLARLGLNPGAADPDGLFLPVSGSIGTFERALSIGFNRYRGPGGGTRFANTKAPQLPRALASSVRGILGLDNLSPAVSSAEPGLGASPTASSGSTGSGTTSFPAARALAASPTGAAQPATTGPQACAAATNTNDKTAAKLSTAYSINSLYGTGDLGAGVTVAIYELEPWAASASDTAAFESCYGISTSVTYESVDGGPIADGNGSDGLETQLDIDNVAELAPSANIIVYQGPNNLDEAHVNGPFDTYKQIIDDDTAKVISTSWGECEADMGFSGSDGAAAENTLFEQAASQGQTILAASGDYGSEGCDYQGSRTQLAVMDPASQPDVTGVGGTSLNNINTTPPTESAWNGSGGGISSFWNMSDAPYQSSAPAGLHVINANASATPCTASGTDCREVPDVSANASPSTPYAVYWDGAWTGVGGTSGAAPLWAGLVALADADTTCAVTPVGMANPALYAIAGSSNYSSAFNDVTSGNNDVGNHHGGLYPAGTGYDMATGLGTPDAAGLLPRLGSPCIATLGPTQASTGSSVTITGENLLGATGVSFGTASANPATISVNATGTSLTVTAPSAPSGSPTVDVTVATARGTTATVSGDRFTYAIPVVSGVSPTGGAISTPVTITGSDFTNAMSVHFGSTAVAAGDFTINSDSSVTLAAPSGPTGTVDVTVTNATGTSATSSADQFTEPASVTSIAPLAGTAGATVTITGNGFASVSGVEFGSIPASFIEVSNTDLTATVPSGPTGTVHVTVLDAGGSSVTTNADRFTYGVPSVNGVAPAAGLAGGSVTLSGSGFANATSVSFGGTSVGGGGFTINSDSSITLAAPSGPAGTVDVTVSNAVGSSLTSVADRFTYGVPVVNGVSPPAGSPGTAVTVSGSGFTNATSVHLGSTVLAAGSFTVNSDSTITFAAPSGPAGQIDATVTDAVGASATSTSDRFTYPASVSSISPDAGLSGAVVTITGVGLSAVTAVNFGSAPASSISPISNTQLRAVAPSQSLGTVHLTLVDAGGTSPTSGADQFTYGAPVVTGVSPNNGAAGQSVTITGSGFANATSVGFGSTTVTAGAFTVNSDTSITLAAPSGPAGLVHVTVSNALGASSTSGADQFTYPATISSISPTAGTAGGPVTITGSGFSVTTGVKFGANAASSFTVVSPSELSAVAPAASGGSPTVHVTVGDAGGSSSATNADRFTYGAPVVSGVSPGAGVTGTTVTLSGSGFANATSVTVGSAAPLLPGNFTVVSDTVLQFSAPSGTNGTLDVRVANEAGTSTVSGADRFTYGAPVVSGVSPATGQSGSIVVLSGSGFINATGVSFGSVAAGSYTINSDTEITVTAPAGAAGTVDVTVGNATGTSARSSADDFTSPPVVAALSSQEGSTSGGETILISGAGFSSVPASGAVNFGATPASYTVLSDSVISVTVPIAAAGTVTVTVVGAGGSSAATALAQFTFETPPAPTTTTAPAPSPGTTIAPPAVTTTTALAPPPPGPVSAARSTLVAAARSVDANGIAKVTLTATLRDARGLAIAGDKVTLRALSGASETKVLHAISNAAGQASFSVRDATAQSVTYRATDATRHVVLGARATVTFGATSSAAASTIALVSGPRASCPGGSSRAKITVSLRAANGVGLAGRLASVGFSRGARATASPTSTLTTANGAASFTVSDKSAQSVNLTVSDAPDSLTLAKSLHLTFGASRRC